MASYLKLQKKGANYFILVPKNMVRAVGAKPGDYFKLTLDTTMRICAEHIPYELQAPMSALSDKDTQYVAVPE